MTLLQVDDPTFIRTVNQEVYKATAIIVEHLEDGENTTLPMAQMYPHGADDLLFMLWTKVGRALGYQEKGKVGKVYNEAQDILNYAAFLLAYLTLQGNLSQPQDPPEFPGSPTG